MAEWKRINRQELNQPRRERIRGVEVKVYFAQDDIPTEVRGEYDECAKKFVVSFKYETTSESQNSRKIDARTTIVEGAKTHKLYKVILDVMPSGKGTAFLDEVRVVMQSLPQSGLATSEDSSRSENYIATSGAYEQVLPRLKEELAGAK